MRLDLSNLNPPVWFDHPDDKDEARICLRVASVKDYDEIRKATTKRRKEYRRNQRFEYEEIDEQKQSALMWQMCIIDWEGIFDDNGPIECNDENKVLLMQNSPQFSKWVTECLFILNEDELERQKSAEKNSLKSQKD